MSLTETNSKIHEPKLYNKVIDDLIHSYYQKKAIEEELQNMENHQTWEYDKFSP